MSEEIQNQMTMGQLLMSSDWDPKTERNRSSHRSRFAGFSRLDLSTSQQQKLYVPVSPGACSSPTDFYVVRQQDVDKVRALTTRCHLHVRDEYNEAMNEYELAPGVRCAAWNTERDLYVRGELVKLDEEEAMVQVREVDTGEMLSVPYKWIYELDDEKLLEAPAYAIHCTLTQLATQDDEVHVMPKWSQKDVNEFTSQFGKYEAVFEECVYVNEGSGSTPKYNIKMIGKKDYGEDIRTWLVGKGMIGFTEGW